MLVSMKRRSSTMVSYNTHPSRQETYRRKHTLHLYLDRLAKRCHQLLQTCNICQRCNRTHKKKYELLPEKKGEITKWSRVNVDLWGPKTVKDKNGWNYQIHMTMVDPVTGWFEQAQLYGSPTAYRCQQIFDTTWLARYPQPREIGFDNEGEFKAEFKQLCANMGLQEKTSLPWKPQSNSILEWIHQVLTDYLTTFELEELDINEDEDRLKSI